MSGEYDLFGGSEAKQIKKIETKSCSPYDVLSLMTQFKMVKRILLNGNIFYGVYAKTKKGWTNLIEVHLNDSNLPETGLNSQGDMISVSVMRIPVNNVLWPLATLFSYDSALIQYSSLISRTMMNVGPKAVLGVLEDVLPHKKLWIRSAKGKIAKETDVEVINAISEYFCVTLTEAREYATMLEQTGDYEEFMDMFNQGGSVKKGKAK